MKRLYRKAESENRTEQFILDWFYQHQSMNKGLIDKIANEHKDCVELEEVYRFVRVKNVDVNEYDVDRENFLNQIKNQIGTITKYTSYSKSKQGVENYINATFDGFGVIVNTSMTGLDIPLLTKKCILETGSQEIEGLQDAILEENELLGLDPSNDYEISAIVFSYDDIEWL